MEINFHHYLFLKVQIKIKILKELYNNNNIKEGKVFIAFNEMHSVQGI